MSGLGLGAGLGVGTGSLSSPVPPPVVDGIELENGSGQIAIETSGIIESKLVMNGQPVEYGEALFAVRAV